MVATWATGKVEEVAEKQRDEKASRSPEERRLPEASREQKEEVWEANRAWRVEEEWDSWDCERVAILQNLRTEVVRLKKESQGLDADDGGEGFACALCSFDDTGVLDSIGDFITDDGGAALDGVGDDGGGGWEWNLGCEGLDACWGAGDGIARTGGSLLWLGLITEVMLVYTFVYMKLQVRNVGMRRDATHTEFAMSSAAFVTRRLAVFATF